MKFAVVAALALAAVASAQNLQINDPTPSTVWTAGKTGYIRWTGVCANKGESARSIKVQLVKGPESAVQFVADLGTIDCTSAQNNSKTLPVPTEAQGSPLETGKYSLRFNLEPDQYSNAFTINGAAPVTPPSGHKGQTRSSRHGGYAKGGGEEGVRMMEDKDGRKNQCRAQGTKGNLSKCRTREILSVPYGSFSFSLCLLPYQLAPRLLFNITLH
ncbi:MAG: hypothetical protein J3R72DRAFT_200022 [Linnemannia gamsii]|nr:MAG: hypothetical protein J3R72DRAFT_200022 [Linnemannia gamsii]